MEAMATRNWESVAKAEIPKFHGGNRELKPESGAGGGHCLNWTCLLWFGTQERREENDLVWERAYK
jgi:hypothetical protein